jgi:hypothetical protein
VTIACAIAWIVSAVSQYRISKYDPNATPVDERLALGRELAVTLEEFNELTKEQEIDKK